MQFCNFKKSFLSSVHKIISTSPMYMYIYKTRRDIFPMCIYFNGTWQINITLRHFNDRFSDDRHCSIWNDPAGSQNSSVIYLESSIHIFFQWNDRNEKEKSHLPQLNYKNRAGSVARCDFLGVQDFEGFFIPYYNDVSSRCRSLVKKECLRTIYSCCLPHHDLSSS